MDSWSRNGNGTNRFFQEKEEEDKKFRNFSFLKHTRWIKIVRCYTYVCLTIHVFFLLFDLNRCDYSYNGTPKIFKNVSLNRGARALFFLSSSIFHTLLSLLLIHSAAFNMILSVVVVVTAIAAALTYVDVCVFFLSHDRGEPYLTEWNIQSYWTDLSKNLSLLACVKQQSKWLQSNNKIIWNKKPLLKWDKIGTTNSFSHWTLNKQYMLSVTGNRKYLFIRFDSFWTQSSAHSLFKKKKYKQNTRNQTRDSVNDSSHLSIHSLLVIYSS